MINAAAVLLCCFSTAAAAACAGTRVLLQLPLLEPSPSASCYSTQLCVDVGWILFRCQALPNKQQLPRQQLLHVAQTHNSIISRRRIRGSTSKQQLHHLHHHRRCWVLQRSLAVALLPALLPLWQIPMLWPTGNSRAGLICSSRWWGWPAVVTVRSYVT